MKRILQIISCLEYGGTEAFVMNNYRVLDKSQYQFDFMVFHEKEYPYISEIESLGGKVYFSGTPSLGNLHKFMSSFKRIVDEGGPYEAVHVHVNIDNGIPLLAAALCKIPIRISHSHDTKGKNVNLLRKPWYKFKELLIKKYATSYLGCSSAAGEYLYGEKLFLKKGKVIPNGINVKYFLSEKKDLVKKTKIDWNIDNDCSLVVGNITRFESKKNSLFIIRVFQKILETVPSAILIMGGPDGGLLDSCIELAERLNIKEHIRFIGTQKDVSAWLKLIDIYLFPSLYEGLGIVLLEAQASGCFCVASDGVAHEADVGVGDVMFIPLKEDACQWKMEILDKYSGWTRPSNELIMAKFIESGFEIEEAHRMLLEVYNDR